MASTVEEMKSPKRLADPERAWWSAADVAHHFGVREDTIVAQAKKGLIPCLRMGHQWRFKATQILAIEGKVNAA